MGISLDDRHANEAAFFEKDPWSAIPSDRAGIKALKRRLNSLAIEASRRTFDDVAVEINKKLNTTRAQLEVLGDPRHTPEAQRLYLLQMASEYQSLVKKAVDAYYGRDECFRLNSNLRLAATIMQENEKFSRNMLKKGSFRVFSAEYGREHGSESELEEKDAAVKNLIRDNDASESSNWSASTTWSTTTFPELLDLVTVNVAEPERSDESVEVWIGRIFKEFKGFEIGSSNPSLITALVFEQTSSWAHHALGHVSNVISRIHRCVHDLLEHICSDAQVHGRLWNSLIPLLSAAYNKALDHAKFLVKIEREGYPLTLNHYFAQTITKRRRARIEQRLRKVKTWVTDDDAKHPLLRISDALDAYVSNEEHSVEELQDVLQSYHKVARKRFVDNVCKQAIDHFLVCSEQGPLHAFSPAFVGMLNEMDLVRLAGEDTDVTAQRKRLSIEVEILIRARKIVA